MMQMGTSTGSIAALQAAGRESVGAAFDPEILLGGRAPDRAHVLDARSVFSGLRYQEVRP